LARPFRCQVAKLRTLFPVHIWNEVHRNEECSVVFRKWQTGSVLLLVGDISPDMSRSTTDRASIARRLVGRDGRFPGSIWVVEWKGFATNDPAFVMLRLLPIQPPA
jgi:hypothetical protein